MTFDGQLNDAEDVIVGSTNASLFAYVADGKNGLKVLQLTSPSSQPNFYGFSPQPKPELIAWAHTPTPALSISKGLDRDRAVDETGNQIAVFGRMGSRPFTRPEMEKFFLDAKGQVYRVTDQPTLDDMIPQKKAAPPHKRTASLSSPARAGRWLARDSATDGGGPPPLRCAQHLPRKRGRKVIERTAPCTSRRVRNRRRRRNAS